MCIGSENYNSPEVNQRNEILRTHAKNAQDFDLSFDGYKADVFAAVSTLFLMFVRQAPFKMAIPEDPHYKRLQYAETTKYWNIFKTQGLPVEFKEFFEKGTLMDADMRMSIQEALSHEFIKTNSVLSEDQLRDHIAVLFKSVEHQKNNSPKEHYSAESLSDEEHNSD